MNTFIAEPMSTNSIVDLVNSIRTTVGFENELYFPVIEFVENFLTQYDETFNYNYVEREKMQDKYAYYDHIHNVMVIREDVYEQAINDNGRHRFTIAHEIGHYFLHQNGVKLCRLESNQHIVRYCDPEWQANTFASELLMPRHLICNLNAKQIAFYCKTSCQAATIALNKAKKSS